MRTPRKSRWSRDLPNFPRDIPKYSLLSTPRTCERVRSLLVNLKFPCIEFNEERWLHWCFRKSSLCYFVWSITSGIQASTFALQKTALKGVGGGYDAEIKEWQLPRKFLAVEFQKKLLSLSTGRFQDAAYGRWRRIKGIITLKRSFRSRGGAQRLFVGNDPTCQEGEICVDVDLPLNCFAELNSPCFI